MTPGLYLEHYLFVDTELKHIYGIHAIWYPDDVCYEKWEKLSWDETISWPRDWSLKLFHVEVCTSILD